MVYHISNATWGGMNGTVAKTRVDDPGLNVAVHIDAEEIEP
jgi:hypothetical protein